MKVHGTSAVLLGLHVLLFTQKVGESKKVRFFFHFNMSCLPRGFRNYEFQIFDKSKVSKSNDSFRDFEMKRFEMKPKQYS